MQSWEGSPFPLYNAPVGLNAEASTAPLTPPSDTEKAPLIIGNQEAMSSMPPVSSPNRGEAIPITRNWSGRKNQGGWGCRIRSRRFIAIALIVLILLLVGSSLPFFVPYLHTILPASTATITITPASKNLNNTYMLSAVTGRPDASQHQIGARQLSYTTPSKSQTVKVTGAGYQDATSATGKLSITSGAHTGVQNQVRANERLVSDVQCNPKITSNHQANDRAADIIVMVAVTCQGEVYDLRAAQSMATDLLKSDVVSQFGASYALVGNVVTRVPTIVTADKGSMVSMNVNVHGVWVYQFSNDQKQNLAKLIAGKTQADTSALLLKQRGIHKVSIATSGGWGAALPAADNIKMVVLSVTGL